MKKANQSGFTLIEVVVSIAVASIVSLAIFSFMLFGQKLYVRSSEQNALTSDMNFIMNSITSRAREANNIYTDDDEIHIRYDDISLITIIYTESESRLLIKTTETSYRMFKNVSKFLMEVDDTGKNIDIVIEGRTKSAHTELETSISFRN